jgi:hypothetical protein
VVVHGRSIRVSDRTQRYTEVAVPSPTNCHADVERRKERVAIHLNKISTTPPSRDQFIRTSANQEIEKYVHEGARRGEDLYRSRLETLCVSGRVAHGNKGCYGTEAGQHPRLNRERDLWRGGGDEP